MLEQIINDAFDGEFSGDTPIDPDPEFLRFKKRIEESGLGDILEDLKEKKSPFWYYQHLRSVYEAAEEYFKDEGELSDWIDYLKATQGIILPGPHVFLYIWDYVEKYPDVANEHDLKIVYQAFKYSDPFGEKTTPGGISDCPTTIQFYPGRRVDWSRIPQGDKLCFVDWMKSRGVDYGEAALDEPRNTTSDLLVKYMGYLVSEEPSGEPEASSE